MIKKIGSDNIGIDVYSKIFQIKLERFHMNSEKNNIFEIKSISWTKTIGKKREMQLSIQKFQVKLIAQICCPVSSV